MSLFNKIMTNISSGNILYYPGCLVKFVAPELGDNYRDLLKRCNVDYLELADPEVCCGSPAINAGGEAEVKELAQKNLQVFLEHGIREIIVSCPACYKIFSQDYPRLLGKAWNIKVTHIVTLLLNKIDILTKNLPQKENLPTVTYHDPCHLGRHSGLYEEPRKLIAGFGFTLKEMTLNKKYAFCCGGGGGLASNQNELSEKVAKNRLIQARETEADILVTPCSMCYLQFKKQAGAQKVMELGELLKARLEGTM